MIIYKTTNLANGKIYIGSDKHNNPEYLGSGKLLKHAINKYGRDSFHKEILEECSSMENLKEREEYWIRKLNSTDRNIGYNISTGYFGGNVWDGLDEGSRKKAGEKIGKSLRGYKHSEEMKEKMRVISKNREYRDPWNKGINIGPHTSEHRRKISDSLKGRERSDEDKKSISEGRIGIKFSVEHRQKLSEANIGKKISDETRKKMSDSKKGIIHQKIKCPFCGKEGGGSSMYRWHFDKCKNNI